MAQVLYKGMKIQGGTPSGNAGLALNDNFKALADRNFFSAPSIAAKSVTNTPPASPVEGDVHIVGTSPTGAWAGQGNQIAFYYSGAWAFVAPAAGWMARDVAGSKLYFFTGLVWAEFTAAAPAGGITRVELKVLYTSTNPTSLDPSTPLPAGWGISFNSPSTGRIAITHNMGRLPSALTMYGIDSGGKYHYRVPTGTSELLSTSPLDAFDFAAATTVTAAASGGSALIVISF